LPTARQKSSLATCCAAHTLHDGLSDLTYVLLPLLAQTFGLSLAQGGEFSLVLIQTSVDAGIVSPAASQARSWAGTTGEERTRP